jgi:hypothetical protein
MATMPLEFRPRIWLPVMPVHALDLAVGHQLGLLERLLDALHGGVDVHHHAALQAVAGATPSPPA